MIVTVTVTVARAAAEVDDTLPVVVTGLEVVVTALEVVEVTFTVPVVLPAVVFLGVSVE